MTTNHCELDRLRVMRGAQRRIDVREACTAAGPFKCSSCPAAGDEPCTLRGPLPTLDDSLYDSDAVELARWADWEQRELVDAWRHVRVRSAARRRRELVAGAIAGVAGVVVGLVLIVVGLGVLP